MIGKRFLGRLESPGSDPFRGRVCLRILGGLFLALVVASTGCLDAGGSKHSASAPPSVGGYAERRAAAPEESFNDPVSIAARQPIEADAVGGGE